MRNRARVSLVVFAFALLVAAGSARGQAISYGGEIAGGCIVLPGGATGLPLTVAAPGAVAGQTVILTGVASGDVSVTSIADSAGNTYALDASDALPIRTFVASSRVTTALAAGGTITIVLGNATGSEQTTCANGAVFSNLVTGAGYFEASGSASGTATTMSATTSGPTTQPNDLVIGVFRTPNVPAYVGTGFTGISPEACIPSPVPVCVHAEFRVVSTTGTQTAVGTLDASQSWDALVAVYKGVVPDMQGATAFRSLPPCRILDTRNATGPLGGPALAPGTPRVFPVLQSACGIPASAKVLSVNATVTQPAAEGHILLYPYDEAAPSTSVLNFPAGRTRANNALVKLPADGSGNVTAVNGASGTVELILDVNGYFE